MREQLIQYVNLLFAGAHDCEDIKQEILQNTLDRYDDLIAEGKVPEAAYRLAITGIGDINEILGTARKTVPQGTPTPAQQEKVDTPIKKILRAVAVFLYIVSPIPLFVLSEFLGMETFGLCGTIAIVGLATALIILGSKKEISEKEETYAEQYASPKSELEKSISQLIGTIGLAAYFIISFLTGAWYITWIIFPLTGAVKGLVKAIEDLKEAKNHEN